MNRYSVNRFVRPSFSLFSTLCRKSAIFLILSVAGLSFGGVVAAAPGDLDTTFGTGGKVTTPVGTGRDLAQAVALQPDGKLVVAGYAQNDFALVRYNANGTLNTDFGSGGKVLTPVGAAADEAYAVAIQTDGKIVVAGHSSGKFAVVRYNPDGSLDAGFGTAGKVITTLPGFALAEAVAIQTDGKIILVGWCDSPSKYAVVRYNADGSPDSSFGTGGQAVIPVGTTAVGGLAHAVAVQTDGKIIVAGDVGVDMGQSVPSRFSAVRLTANGALDSSFGTGGKVVTAITAGGNSKIYDVIVQPDGKIVASGVNDMPPSGSDTAIVRYNPDGSPDSSFGAGGIVTTRVGTVASIGEAVNIQANGKIIVAGSSYSGSAAERNDFGALRLNADGTLDFSFGTGGKVITPIGSREDQVRDALIQPDGKIIVVGHSENAAAGFNEDFALVRYQGDSATVHRAPFDFDGDGKTDIGIFRASDGSWWYSRSSDDGFRVFSFGTGTDLITPGDFTGDGKADLAVFRPSEGVWFIQRSEDNSFFSFPFGASGDIPAPADYDGDGKTDAAVYRPSSGTWFILNSGGGGTGIVQFGTSEDKPVPADFDGDGKADIAIFRPSDGSWWYLRSIDSQFRVFRFGISTDKPVQGDYTGDGKADIAVFRPSTGEWFVQRSEDNSFYSVPFGAAGDVPIPGDYDDDGRFDTAVFRPATANWFVHRSTAGILITTFGTSGDRPIPNAFVP